MKIIMNVNPLTGQMTGIGYYVRNLLKNITQIDNHNNYIFYSYFLKKKKIDSQFIQLSRNYKSKTIRIPQKFGNFMFQKAKIPIEIFVGKFDILHTFDHTAPYSINGKLVITVHDIGFYLANNSEFINDETNRYVKTFFPGLIKRADKIIAVSKNTKRDIIRIFGTPEDKISVVYEAAEDIFLPIKDSKILKGILEKYKLPPKYILYVGTIEPRKNIDTLIKAFNILKKKYKIPHSLVLIGVLGWSYNKIFRLIKDLKIQNDILIKEYVRREDLPKLYNLADIFVYPSLYEGFGLPPIEAMACGTPVITSNTSCFPETVGDCGQMFSPYDQNELSEMIYFVLNDRALYKGMVEKGLKRVKLFSWKKAAIDTLSVYKSLY